MIVVRVEHWPDGDRKRRRCIGIASITNTRTGDDDVGSYAVELFGPVRKGHGSRLKVAEATFHAPSKGKHVAAFRVVARGILAALKERF